MLLLTKQQARKSVKVVRPNSMAPFDLIKCPWPKQKKNIYMWLGEEFQNTFVFIKSSKHMLYLTLYIYLEICKDM